MRIGNFIITENFDILVSTAVIADVIKVSTGKAYFILRKEGVEYTEKGDDGWSFFTIGILKEFGEKYKNEDEERKEIRWGNFIIDKNLNVLVSTAIFANVLGFSIRRAWRILKRFRLHVVKKTYDKVNFYKADDFTNFCKKYTRIYRFYKTMKDMAKLVGCTYGKLRRIADSNEIKPEDFIDGMFWYNPQQQYRLLSTYQKYWEKKYGKLERNG